MHRSHGHCMTMGTASTMASMVEALGVGTAGQRRDPGGRCAPQRAGARWRAAASSSWSKEDLLLSQDPDARGVRERDPRQRRDRRLDQRGDPPDRDRAAASASSSRSRTGTAFGRDVHTLVNLHAVSGKYLMEDFCYAGGLPVVLRELGEPAAQQGRADRQRQDDLGERQGRAGYDLERPKCSSVRSPSRSRRTPASRCCAATSRPTARSSSLRRRRPQLMKHKGRAVVFENIEDFHARIDDPKPRRSTRRA